MSESFEKWKAAGMIGAWLMVSDADAKVIWEAAHIAGVQAERERCAMVAEQKAGHVGYPIDCCQEDYENYLIGLDIAAAIRKEAGE